MAGPEDRGSGAEAYARKRQNDYHLNANLVLTANREGRPKGKEPTGEPETLAGRRLHKMGDRAAHTLPDELEELKKRKPKAAPSAENGAAKRARVNTVLEADKFGSYQPKSRETRDAYGILLQMVQSRLGDYPTEILYGAAEEVLTVLKDDNKRVPDKEKEVRELLECSEQDLKDHFHEFIDVGNRITDWGAEEEGGGSGEDDEMGVAVDFDDEAEEDEGGNAMVATVVPSDDEDDAGGDDAGGASNLNAQMDLGAAEDDELALAVTEIDAYWLQRAIADAFKKQGEPLDAAAAQQKDRDVLRLLAGDRDAAELEPDLVYHLGYKNFELIKVLVANRNKVAWCTRLMRAKSDEETAGIEAQMFKDPNLTDILAQLKATRASARDRKNAMIQGVQNEARRLHENEVGAKGAEVVHTEVAARQVLDLESLQFEGGGHYFASKKVQLPKETFRRLEKGYEEVCIPPPKKQDAKGQKLIPITELPEWAQPAFDGMASLNAVQSKVCDTALHTANNMLLCAPTGAGKTNVAMLSILQVIGSALQPDGTINTDAFKIVYIAPMKALVAEMVGNFQKRLDERFGIRTRELTGDVGLSKAEIEETQIIVTTPEKWDIVTRRAGERTYTQLVKLVIIDEVHLLHDDRGPVLECIIARTLRQVESTAEMVRLVGLSATLPNYRDVGTLLRVKPDHCFFFSAAYRPCPLAQTFIGVTIKKPLQRFQLMNEICYKKIMDAAGKHQVLIFVHSRKETAKTARFLRDKATEDEQLNKIMSTDASSREILQSEAESTADVVLKDVMPYGFATHHAGMKRVDRTNVEDLFAAGHVKILVSTATLAWGVNLPAHTVIIKGTQVYNPTKSGWDELSPQDVMQMLGRAGRPQYDSFGEGIIITQHSELTYYLSLLNEQLPIESQFVKRLTDSLNAEIVLGSLQNLRDAANWLGYTYLNIRMMKKPQQYGVPVRDSEEDPKLLKWRKDLVHSAALELDRNSLIRYDRKTGNFQATDLGRIASQYYITHTTLREYNEHLKPTMAEIELLRVFCLADEFKYMVVRDEEKLELVRLSQRVPIPIKDSVEEPSAKINVLLQAYISGLKLEGLALMADMVYISQSASRLMRCLFDICLRRNWAPLTEKALLLVKAVTHRMWPSQTPLRQFKGKLRLPPQQLTTLEKKDIPWERYFDMRPAQIGELIGAAKLGKVVKKMINMVPRLQLDASIQPLTRGLLRVDLMLTPDFQWDQEAHGYVEPFLILVEDQDSEFVLHKEFFFLKMTNATGDRIVDHPVTFTVPIPEPLPPQFFIRVVSDRWLGSESITPVSFRNVVLPERFHPPTELLDLQPLPVSALRNKQFEGLYGDFTHFNAIQTQVFSTLFGGQDNALVCAPTGSGKTVCAEFALMALVNHVEAKRREAEAEGAEGVTVPPLRAVYVASLPAIVEQTKTAWETRFGSLGLNIVQLTGEQQVDLKRLQRGNIILATAEQWDRLSLRWRKKRAVSVTDISLFIADELHLLGAEGGPTLEVVVSRMRAIAKLLSKPIRIVGLGSSMADGKEVGDWIGAPSHAQFCFPPGSRPVPLEIHIQSMDITSFEARMQAMSRPTYNTVLQYAKAKPAIIFAPTRRHAQSIATDILTYTAGDAAPTRFLKVPLDTLEPFLERVTDTAAHTCASAGVGILHDTMSQEDIKTINHLFTSNALQVLVVTAGMCRSVAAPASLVVVMGTQYFDSSGLGGEDFPVPELLQMLGVASRPLQDDAGIAVIMCHAAKKEYYKKFLFEPLPVESHLDMNLHDHMVSEIAVETINNKQEAVDWLTYTFFYRRLPQNPNYYNMMGRSHRHIRDHLSELVEDVCAELHDARAILVDETGFNIQPENLGIITAYHHISFKTAHTAHEALSAKVKTKGMITVLSHATEFEGLPIRPGEESAVLRMLKHAKYEVPSLAVDARTKANAVLQAHISRVPLRGDLLVDQREVVKTSVRLLHAMVDILSNKNALNACIVAMELCQMVTQALHTKDSFLLQLPGVTRALADKCEAAEVEDLGALQEMDDAARRRLLALPDAVYADVAAFCNRYPDDVSVVFAVTNGKDVSAPDDEDSRAFEVDGDSGVVEVQVQLSRDTPAGPVIAPHFPGTKEEFWWLICGDNDDNVLAIKRFSFDKQHKAKLVIDNFKPGSNTFKLLVMCDSYLGCDQEYPFDVTVAGGDQDGEAAAMETS